MYSMHNGFLFRKNKLCVRKCSLHNLLVREAYMGWGVEGDLMGHFGICKTLGVFYEHFFWPHMKHDVERICEK